MATEKQGLQQTLAAAKAQGLLPADADLPQEQHPSWVILALSFLGAQLAVWPFLGFLLFTLYELLGHPSSMLILGSLLALSVMFLAAGVFMLRTQERGIFFTQLGLNVLLVGIGMLCWLFGEMELGRSFLPLLAACLLVLVFVIRVQWVQILLGMAFAMVAAQIDLPGLLGFSEYLGDRSFIFFSLRLWNVWLLAAAWWAWCAFESRCGSRPWVPAAYALMQGLAVGVLLTVLFSATNHLQSSGAAGSADVMGAGQQALFHFSFWSAGSSLLVVASGLWLFSHWGWWANRAVPAFSKQQAQHAGHSQAHAVWQDVATWALLYGLWAVVAWVMPAMGVLAVLFTAALATGRWRVLMLTLLVALAQLSAFYYALQWPLLDKAVLLGALGGVLALALGALHASQQAASAQGVSRDAAHASAAPSAPSRRGLIGQRVGLALAMLLTLGLTQWDAVKKEQVLTHGQKIYISLVPQDPRSLMQGDYMALRFELPLDLLESGGDDHTERLLQPTLLVVAKLDAQGIATLQRRYRSGEALAANEVVIPLKYMKGDWVVVTNAYFFPEGQGRVFSNARYGEFRALGKGKVLLAGLADDKLQRIEPSPDAWREDDTSTPQAEDTVTPPDGAGEGVAEPAVPPASETR